MFSYLLVFNHQISEDTQYPFEISTPHFPAYCVTLTFAVRKLPGAPRSVLVAAVHVTALHLEARPAVVGDTTVVVVAALLLEAVQDLARVATLLGCRRARQRRDVDGKGIDYIATTI